MKQYFKLIALFLGITTVSCEKEIRDITQKEEDTNSTTLSSEVNPTDINSEGFDFLEKMQGHWVGTNKVMTTEYDWFGWDFRAISPSHVHGIFEGGTMGNLFVSFFVTNFKNKRTIMARNGGVLNGIYRTSYFVMDKVQDLNTEGKSYRFVDAVGGQQTMSMELRFKNDSLYFNVYTSNLGNVEPTRHMTFKATKMHPTLAQTAAIATGFPQNSIDTGLDFAGGFDTQNLYVAQPGEAPKSATFLAQGGSNDVYALAPQSGDPYTINDHPRLGTLTLNLTRNSGITNDNLLVYLSKDPLTDNSGYLTTNLSAYNTFLHFPALSNGENSFRFTYLHPGDYYVTVVADKNNDSAPSAGDVVSISTQITLAPLENKVENITNIDVQN